MDAFSLFSAICLRYSTSVLVHFLSQNKVNLFYNYSLFSGIHYLHKGSCSQLRGKPNNCILTDGCLANSCLKSATKVLLEEIELSQYTT